MTAAALMAALTGVLTLRPGQGAHAIGSSRAPLAGPLLRGRPAEQAAHLLPRVFSLCGQAHRVAANLALAAAHGNRSGADLAAPASDHALLAAETLREHVRRMMIDWPRLVGQADDGAAAALRTCPLFGAPTKAHNGGRDGDMALRAWVEREVLGDSIAAWLARWNDDQRACLRHWSRRARTLPARLMCAIEQDADTIDAGAPALRAHASEEGMRALAAELAADACFEQAPHSAGGARETGSWTRLGATDALPDDAWLRMGARVAEVCALAAAGHTAADGAPLAHGALALAPGEALAWTEMARGLLCHWVKLDLNGDGATIADYRVVAPTEWNFHPQGAVASALAAMPAGGNGATRMATTRRIGVLAAAFDPCVNIEIEFSHA